MLNILNLSDSSIMLGINVKSYMEAVNWLDYYKKSYGVGVPYENGEGYYDNEFVICRQCECCEVYHVIQ